MEAVVLRFTTLIYVKACAIPGAEPVIFRNKVLIKFYYWAKASYASSMYGTLHDAIFTKKYSTKYRI